MAYRVYSSLAQASKKDIQGSDGAVQSLTPCLIAGKCSTILDRPQMYNFCAAVYYLTAVSLGQKVTELFVQCTCQSHKAL